MWIVCNILWKLCPTREDTPQKHCETKHVVSICCLVLRFIAPAKEPKKAAPVKKEEAKKPVAAKKEEPKVAAKAAKKAAPAPVAAAPAPVAAAPAPAKVEKEEKTVKAVAAKPAPKKRGVVAKAAAAAGKGRVAKKQLRGKGLKKKKIQLRFAIDCTNIAEDSIMDVADFVRILFHFAAESILMTS